MRNGLDMGEQALRALVASTHRGVLTTLRRDGRPQLSNVSYWLDGDVIRLSVTDTRAKTRNLRRDPRASLYVGREDFGAYAVVEGTADVSAPAAAVDDPVVEELVDYYRGVRGEHPDWDEYRRAMVDDARVVVRLPVGRVYGMA